MELRSYTFVLLECFLSFTTFGGDLNIQSTGPVLYIPRTHFDLGRIAPMETKKFTIELCNRGKEKLIVYSITSDCGCISQAKEWKNKAIAPGECEKSDFFITIGEARGKGEKKILIKTNAPERPYQFITINYWAAHDYKYTIIPNKLNLGNIDYDQPKKMEMILISPYTVPLHVNSIILPSDKLKLIEKTEASTSFPTRRYELEVPSDFPCGYFYGEIIIQCEYHLITVPVEFYKDGVVEYLPKKLIFPSLKNNESVSHRLILKSRNNAFQISKIYSETDDIDCIYGNDISTIHTILVRICPREKKQGVYHSSIVVMLSGDKEVSEEVTIECVYFLSEEGR